MFSLNRSTCHTDSACFPWILAHCLCQLCHQTPVTCQASLPCCYGCYSYRRVHPKLNSKYSGTCIQPLLQALQPCRLQTWIVVLGLALVAAIAALASWVYARSPAGNLGCRHFRSWAVGVSGFRQFRPALTDKTSTICRGLQGSVLRRFATFGSRRSVTQV